MAIGLLGKKLGMTQIFDENGVRIPVTLIQAGPCPIIQKRVPEKDGYSALQIGFEGRSAKNVTRPMIGHFKKAGVDPVRMVREMRVDDTADYEVGQSLGVDLFSAGEKVDVVGVSRGRGFSGVIRRHNNRRGPTTHGSHYHRGPGSMGPSAWPAHVFKGKKLPGQYGNARTSVQSLKVVSTDPERNILVVKGSVPGADNGYLMIRKSVKGAKKKA